MNIAEYNRFAWDQQVGKGNRWTVPVSGEEIAAARQGRWNVVLTPQKSVPKSWFPPVHGLNILCLASGGGQQAPILAAAGARVTVLDNSPRQLEQDQMVARRDGLQIDSVLGDMRDLSSFPLESFDIIFNPCSVTFIPDVQKVFNEARRVLRPGGRLMCGFVNPIKFVFDEVQLDAGIFHVRHALPYSDESHLTIQEQERLKSEGEPFIFSHSLENLIAGQLRASFGLLDLFEDTSTDDKLSLYLPVYFATLAKKLGTQQRPVDQFVIQ